MSAVGENTPLNLARLQAALSDWVDDRLGIAGGSEMLEECARAVLEAPTEWRCNWSYTEPTEGCRSGEHRIAGHRQNGECYGVALVEIGQ